MSDDIQIAFDHPMARAESGLINDHDRLSVRDFIKTVEIGAFQAERGTTQRLRFNVVVEVDRFPADIDDDVDRILSYDKITEAIEGELSEERLNLLETLAERIAARILIEPQSKRVFVRIEKLDRGPGNLGVEIVRARTATDNVRTLADTPHPIIIFFTNDAIATPSLSDWIDKAAAHDRPVILCIGASDAKRPTAKHAMAQRRIDLLDIEQNAWILADKDPRCVVVSSRTELDWGMRNDQIGVWALSKMVLDAVDGPAQQHVDMSEILNWFRDEMQAAEVIVVGSQDAPQLENARFADAEQVQL